MKSKMSTMQTLGCMNLRGTGKGFEHTVLILVRPGTGKNNYGNFIKLRKSGKKGTHFKDEELFLNAEIEQGDPDRVLSLMDGETIFC